MRCSYLSRFALVLAMTGAMVSHCALRPAWGICIRDDTDPSLYMSLANTSFAFSGIVTNASYGSGVLISPNWILTAGHTNAGVGTTFSSNGGGARSIVEAHTYPGLDITVARLSSPITNITPVELYNADAFGSESGQECYISGAGMTGTGITGQNYGPDYVNRAAQSCINSALSTQLVTYFRRPSAGAALLEGSGASGDSGGGVYMTVNGEHALAGIQSWSYVPIGTYGTGSGYVRTAEINDWIRSYATDASVIATSLYRSGTGTWSGSNWATTSGGSYANGWSAGDNAVFEGTAGTVTISSGTTVSANNLTFNTAGCAVAGGSLSFLASGGIINTGAGIDATIASTITGSNPLRKNGDGTLHLTGANDYSGSTFVNAGVLQAKSDGAIPGYNTAGRVVVQSGGTLAVNAGGTGEWGVANIQALLSNAAFNSGSVLGIDTTNAATGFTYGNAITGSVGISKLGTGTLTLTGANNYTGVTTINAGTLAIGDGTTDGSLGYTNIVNNSAMVYNNVNDRFHVGTINGTGSLTKNGAGMMFLFYSAAYSGPTTINGGSVVVNAITSADSVPSNFTMTAANTAIIFRSYSAETGQAVSGVISGNGNVVTQGSGTVRFTATHTYTGATTVTDGTLQVAAPNSATGTLGTSSSILVTNNGRISVEGDNALVGWSTSASKTIQIDAGSAIVNNGSYSNHLNALVLNGGTLSAAVANSTFGNWSFDGGVSTPGNGSTSTILGGTAALSQSGGTVFNIGVSDTLNVSATLIHTPWTADTGLIKNGQGTLTLSGANTFTGTTTINAGTLAVTSAGSLLLDINATGGSTQILGAGALMLDGKLVFDLTDAGTGRWNEVATSTLAETYGSGFGVMFGATPAVESLPGVWTYRDSLLGRTMSFTESTGVLLISIPEPGILMLLVTGLIGLLAYAWRSRRGSSTQSLPTSHY